MAANRDPSLDLFAGDGTWNREARHVVRLAAARGISLDAESLLLRDVRELQALRLGLQRGQDRRRPRRWLAA